ncbi:hypothetical protein [Streptomyces tendae]|uniref:hypothetical protein n=1 Tax=Streptomyces tendae TaxID=1932 RepID=UPI002491006C|nr:hypothetical protein [Streptomyces tendae]
MAGTDTGDERPRPRWQDGLWAIGATALVVGVGSLMLGLAVVFLGWLTWYNLRFDRRLSQMRGRLRS